MVRDEQEIARLTDELEGLLRAFHARPDRCCHKSCLHCPERTWRLGDPLPAGCD